MKTAYGGPRRKQAESPDDIVRKLSRMPANKKCCDCGTIAPNAVNLSVGSFICLTCAGIHREQSCRIKSIGHSSFTMEEAEFLKSSDNDQINAIYLATCSTDRAFRPTNNSDQQALRTWITRKYKDKLWYRDPNAPASSAELTAAASGPTNTTTSSVAAQYRQPTVAQLPPKNKSNTAAAPVVDLFGDGGGSNHSATVAAQASSSWDAFGNASASQQRQQVNNQFANFGNNDNAAFPADFGSSQTKQNFANFDQQQQQQPLPQNFAHFSAQSFPSQSAQHQQQQQNNQFVANFPNAPTATSPTQQKNFANFPPLQPGMMQQTLPQPQNFTMQQPPQQQVSQMSAGSVFPNTHPQQGMTQPIGNFANFPSEQPNPMVQQPQNFAAFPAGHPMVPQGQDGFASLQLLHSTPGGQQPQAQQSVAGSFGSFPQQQQPQAPQQTSQTMEQMATDRFDAFNSIQDKHPALQPSPNTNAALDFPSASAQASSTMDEPNGGNVVDTNTPPTATMSNLSISQDTKESTAKRLENSKYKPGQKAFYRCASYVGSAEVVKVHLDDDLVPYYTIRVEGKEKQTDDAHLSESNPMHEDVIKLLWELSDAQILQVKQYIMNISNGNDGSTPGKGSTASIPVQSFGEIGLSVSQQHPSSHIAAPTPPQQFHAPQQSTNQQQQHNSGLSQPNQQIAGMLPVVSAQMQQLPQQMGSTMNSMATGISDSFSGIPSPEGGVITKPQVQPLQSIPAPPFVGKTMSQPMQMHHSHSSSEMHANNFPAMPQQQIMTSNVNNQMQFDNRQQQQQYPPQNMMMGNTTNQTQQADTPQTPASDIPLSPKGNPFDFY